MRGGRRQRAARGCTSAAGVLAWLMMCAVPAVALAQPEGRFEVLSAYTDLRDGVYYLSARISYHLPGTAREALLSGVTLTTEVQIEIDRLRAWLPDKNVASLRQRYSLEYHPLTKRYVVRNMNSGDQASFSTLLAAERSLGEIRELPVLDATLLEPDARYEIAIRAVLDIKRLPVPLRLFAAFLDDWRIASEWFRWRVRFSG